MEKLLPPYLSLKLHSLYHHGRPLLSLPKIDPHRYSEVRAKTTDFLQAAGI